MQPQHRNQNGFMFGGYVARRALEVGWLSAFRCCRHPPSFGGVDDILFLRPVRVGCVLEYTGRVVYASTDGSMRVYVEAHTLDLRTGAREQTNEFHLVFHANERVLPGGASTLGDAHGGATTGAAPSPEVHPGMQPDTYEEAMLYLEGRRRWLAAFAFAADPAPAKL